MVKLSFQVELLRFKKRHDFGGWLLRQLCIAAFHSLSLFFAFIKVRENLFANDAFLCIGIWNPKSLSQKREEINLHLLILFVWPIYNQDLFFGLKEKFKIRLLTMTCVTFKTKQYNALSEINVWCFLTYFASLNRCEYIFAFFR